MKEVEKYMLSWLGSVFLVFLGLLFNKIEESGESDDVEVEVRVVCLSARSRTRRARRARR